MAVCVGGIAGDNNNVRIIGNPKTDDDIKVRWKHSALIGWGNDGIMVSLNNIKGTI